MVNVVDPYGRNLKFPRPEPLPFLSSSSSIVHVTNQNVVLEEIKRRLNSGNAYILSSYLLFKNVEIR
jgi:hypothetical protein